MLGRRLQAVVDQGTIKSWIIKLFVHGALATLNAHALTAVFPSLTSKEQVDVIAHRNVSLIRLNSVKLSYRQAVYNTFRLFPLLHVLVKIPHLSFVYVHRNSTALFYIPSACLHWLVVYASRVSGQFRRLAF